MAPKKKVAAPGKVDDDPTTIPEKIRSFVSEEIWLSWSPIRRESFLQIVKNPNTFFYRNRPPGDPQKFGQFTRAEESQFLERLQYFRETLKIDDGLWGLFSVPIRGRLGYQCSNFYRQLIKERKIKDDRYEVMSDGKLKFTHGSNRGVPPESGKILEKEAFDFINACLDGENAPQIVGPIRVESDRVQKVVVQSRSGLARMVGRSRGLADRRSHDEATHGAKGGGVVDVRKSPVWGALDPISGEPMQMPMMDEGGFVMDLRSWRRVFRSAVQAPCASVAENEGDLIEITARNFADLRLRIVNVYC